MIAAKPQPGYLIAPVAAFCSKPLIRVIHEA